MGVDVGGGQGGSPILHFGFEEINDMVVHVGNRAVVASNLAIHVGSLAAMASRVPIMVNLFLRI